MYVSTTGQKYALRSAAALRMSCNAAAGGSSVVKAPKKDLAGWDLLFSRLVSDFVVADVLGAVLGSWGG